MAEDQLGPWVFYIVFACMMHAKYHTILMLAGIVFSRARSVLFTLANALAVSSGGGFLVSLAWGNDWDPGEAVVIAQRLCLGASIAGVLLFVQCLTSWRGLYEEMSRPVWSLVTGIGGCGLFILMLVLPWLLPIPGAELIVALLLMGFLACYWSPTLMIPWVMLGTVDPGSRLVP